MMFSCFIQRRFINYILLHKLDGLSRIMNVKDGKMDCLKIASQQLREVGGEKLPPDRAVIQSRDLSNREWDC